MIDVFSAVRTNDMGRYLTEIRLHDINIKNETGANLLHMAVAYDRRDIAADLVSRGIDLDSRNGEGMTALISAVISNRSELAKLFITNGAGVDIYDNYGNDALWYAIGSPIPDFGLISLLLEKGADRFHRNAAGLNPMDVADQIGDERLIELMTAE